MKIRYKQTKKGPREVAKIYSPSEHKIDYSKIDGDAINVVEKLTYEGYETFIVGGAVRDLMLGIIPKDFDVATEASPRQVHKLFRNSRIIGKRFKIVHVVFKDKIIEVSTFRSTKEHDDDNDNQFGTVEEDAKRRDFSINSLYYNPLNETIVDFNNAFKDFEQKKITSLIPLNKTFIEDPVRMIRAIKAHVSTGFGLSVMTKMAIKRYSSELGKISTSRLTEELNKILCSGHSAEIIKELHEYKLLVYILPCISLHAGDAHLYEALRKHDAYVQSEKENGLGKTNDLEYYSPLFSSFIVLPDNNLTYQEKKSDVIRQAKILLSPNTPPNLSLERSAVKFLSDNNINPVKRKKKKKKKKKLKAEAVGGASLVDEEFALDDESGNVSESSSETGSVVNARNISDGGGNAVHQSGKDNKSDSDKPHAKPFVNKKLKEKNRVYYQRRREKKDNAQEETKDCGVNDGK